MIVCRDKFEEIMEEVNKADDPTFSQLLINLDEQFSVLYDRWILFFTNYDSRNSDRNADQVQTTPGHVLAVPEGGFEGG